MEFRWNFLIFLIIVVGMIIIPASAKEDWICGSYTEITDSNNNRYYLEVQFKFNYNKSYSDCTLKQINLFRTKAQTIGLDGGSCIVLYKPDTCEFDWYTTKIDPKRGFGHIPDQYLFTKKTNCYTNVSYYTLKELYNKWKQNPKLFIYGHPNGMDYVKKLDLDAFFKEHEMTKTYTVAGQTIFYYKVIKDNSNNHWIVEKMKQGGLLQQKCVENIDLTNCKMDAHINHTHYTDLVGCTDFITVVDRLGTNDIGDDARKIISVADKLRDYIPGVIGAILREIHPLIAIGNTVYYLNELSDVLMAMSVIDEVYQHK